MAQQKCLAIVGDRVVTSATRVGGVPGGGGRGRDLRIRGVRRGAQRLVELHVACVEFDRSGVLFDRGRTLPKPVDGCAGFDIVGLSGEHLLPRLERFPAILQTSLPRPGDLLAKRLFVVRIDRVLGELELEGEEQFLMTLCAPECLAERSAHVGRRGGQRPEPRVHVGGLGDPTHAVEPEAPPAHQRGRGARVERLVDPACEQAIERSASLG